MAEQTTRARSETPSSAGLSCIRNTVWHSAQRFLGSLLHSLLLCLTLLICRGRFATVLASRSVAVASTANWAHTAEGSRCTEHRPTTQQRRSEQDGPCSDRILRRPLRNRCGGPDHLKKEDASSIYPTLVCCLFVCFCIPRARVVETVRECCETAALCAWPLHTAVGEHTRSEHTHTRTDKEAGGVAQRSGVNDTHARTHTDGHAAHAKRRTAQWAPPHRQRRAEERCAGREHTENRIRHSAVHPRCIRMPRGPIARARLVV